MPDPGDVEEVVREGVGLNPGEPAEAAEKVGETRWKGKEGISPTASGDVRTVLSRPLMPVGLLLENGIFVAEEERSDSEEPSLEKVLKRSVLVSVQRCSAVVSLVSSSVRDRDLLWLVFGAPGILAGPPPNVFFDFSVVDIGCACLCWSRRCLSSFSFFSLFIVFRVQEARVCQLCVSGALALV